MRIKFLKDHVVNFSGDEIDTTQHAGEYLIKMGVAEKVDVVIEGKKEVEIIDEKVMQLPEKEKVEVKISKKKKYK